jgi:large subunit ribosomal protein L1
MSFVPRENLVEAVREALQAGPRRNFKESVDLVVVLRDVNLKSPQGRIREVVFLPNKPNKDVTICVVAEGDMALKAKELADMVLSRSDLQAMLNDRKQAKKVAGKCDWVLVQTDLMPLVGRSLAPALGPRGKMPIPVPPSADIKSFVERYRSAVMLRTKDQPQVMCRVGTEDMEPEKIADNIAAVLSALEAKLPNGSQNIAKIVVKRTMGPPIEVRVR